MTLATHRDALVALLESVPAIGMVHGFERYLRDETAFRAAYLYTPLVGDAHLRGWWLRNTAIRETELGVGRLLVRYSWRVRGLMALQDALATELEFDELTEAVRAAYRADPTLGGLSTAEVEADTDAGMQKSDAGPVMFCGVLCHAVTLDLTTREYL